MRRWLVATPLQTNMHIAPQVQTLIWMCTPWPLPLLQARLRSRCWGSWSGSSPPGSSAACTTGPGGWGSEPGAGGGAQQGAEATSAGFGAGLRLLPRRRQCAGMVRLERLEEVWRRRAGSGLEPARCSALVAFFAGRQPGLTPQGGGSSAGACKAITPRACKAVLRKPSLRRHQASEVGSANQHSGRRALLYLCTGAMERAGAPPPHAYICLPAPEAHPRLSPAAAAYGHFWQGGATCQALAGIARS